MIEIRWTLIVLREVRQVERKSIVAGSAEGCGVSSNGQVIQTLRERVVRCYCKSFGQPLDKTELRSLIPRVAGFHSLVDIGKPGIEPARIRAQRASRDVARGILIESCRHVVRSGCDIRCAYQPVAFYFLLDRQIPVV